VVARAWSSVNATACRSLGRRRLVTVAKAGRDCPVPDPTTDAQPSMVSAMTRVARQVPVVVGVRRTLLGSLRTRRGSYQCRYPAPEGSMLLNRNVCVRQNLAISVLDAD
jgi:hypothetical protein